MSRRILTPEATEASARLAVTLMKKAVNLHQELTKAKREGYRFCFDQFFTRAETQHYMQSEGLEPEVQFIHEVYGTCMTVANAQYYRQQSVIYSKQREEALAAAAAAGAAMLIESAEEAAIEQSPSPALVKEETVSGSERVVDSPVNKKKSKDEKLELVLEECAECFYTVDELKRRVAAEMNQSATKNFIERFEKRLKEKHPTLGENQIAEMCLEKSSDRKHKKLLKAVKKVVPEAASVSVLNLLAQEAEARSLPNKNPHDFMSMCSCEAASAESANPFSLEAPKVLEVEKNTEPEGTPVEEVKTEIKTVPLSPQVETEINNFKSIFSFHARRRVKPKQMKKNFVQQFINCLERCYTKEKTLDYMREHCMPSQVEEFFNMFMERLAGIGREDWYNQKAAEENQKAAEEKVLDTKIQDFHPMLSFLARTHLKPNHMKNKFLKVFRSCLERGYSKERILHQLKREDCDCEDHKVEKIFERFREYLGGSGRQLYDKKVGEQNKGVSELEDPVLVKRALSRFLLKKMGADHLYRQITNLGEADQKTIGVLCLRMKAAERQEEKDILSHDLFCHCDSCERSYRSHWVKLLNSSYRKEMESMIDEFAKQMGD